MKGKYAYSSPEQLKRESVDRRSDVFAAGVVLWETLTGVPLFAGVDLIDTITRVIDATVADPRTIVPSLPQPVALVATRALARNPNERFPTAAAMRDALDDAAHAAGVSATAKDVAELVQRLCGDALAPKYDALREASRTESAPESPTMVDQAAPGGDVLPPSLPSAVGWSVRYRPSIRWALLLATTVVFFAFYAARHRQLEALPVVGDAPRESTYPPSAPRDAPLEISQETRADRVPPAPSSSSGGSTSSPPRRSTTTPRVHRSVPQSSTGATSSGPPVRYANPYEGK
jgi:hypothetical protein